MRDKFGLQFVIVNGELMAEVRRTHGLHANPSSCTTGDRVHGMAAAGALPALRDVYAQAKNPKLGKRFAFDMLIVDEAHHVAPSALGHRRRTRLLGGRKRTIAVRQLAETLRAPPVLERHAHWRLPESFTALMEMIDPAVSPAAHSWIHRAQRM